MAAQEPSHTPVEFDARDSRAQFTRLPVEEAFANAANRFVHDLWQKKRNGRRLPARADFDPLELRPFLSQIILIEVQPDPPDFRYRLAGTSSRDLRGMEMTGHSVLDLRPREHGTRLWNDLCEMQRTLELQYVRINVITNSGEPLSYRVLRLPLGSDGQTLDMVMVVQDYGGSLPLLRKYFDEARSGSAAGR